MKIYLFLLSILLISSNIHAQKSSDLYLKVIEVMATELNHKYDSTRDKVIRKKEVKTMDSAQPKGLPPSVSTITDDLPPLLILDGMPLKAIALQKYTLSDIETLEVLQPDDPKTAAIYGTRGAHKGVIQLTSKKEKN